MTIYEIIDLTASFVTIIGLGVTVLIFFSQKKQEKKAFTIEKVEELFAEHDLLKEKELSKNYMDYVVFTRKVNRFAIDYNEKLFNKDLISKRVRDFLLRIYDDKLKQIIEQQRKQFDREDYFINIEYMISDLRK